MSFDFYDISGREKEILEYLATGLTNKQIAKHLGLSPRTIEVHRSRINLAFGVHTSSQLFSQLSELGVLPDLITKGRARMLLPVVKRTVRYAMTKVTSPEEDSAERDR